MWEPILMLLELRNQMASGLLSWLSLDLYILLYTDRATWRSGHRYAKGLKKW